MKISTGLGFCLGFVSGFVSGFFLLRSQSFSELLAACICLFSQHFCTSKWERGASASAPRHCAHVLRPRGYQTDEQAPQNCRECLCSTFQSRARLYVDAVSMAKPSRRDVTGKEIYSTSYEPSKVRCAFVFFFCSPWRGHIFGMSAQWKRYSHTICIAHGVARLFAWSRGAGEHLNARQVEQNKTCSAKHMQITSS